MLLCCFVTAAEMTVISNGSSSSIDHIVHADHTITHVLNAPARVVDGTQGLAQGFFSRIIESHAKLAWSMHGDSFPFA